MSFKTKFLLSLVSALLVSAFRCLLKLLIFSVFSVCSLTVRFSISFLNLKFLLQSNNIFYTSTAAAATSVSAVPTTAATTAATTSATSATTAVATTATSATGVIAKVCVKILQPIIQTFVSLYYIIN